jgi:hypothetical protein
VAALLVADQLGECRERSRAPAGAEGRNKKAGVCLI